MVDNEEVIYTLQKDLEALDKENFDLQHTIEQLEDQISQLQGKLEEATSALDAIEQEVHSVLRRL